MTLEECFSDSLIRGLMSVCEETGLTPDIVAKWVREQGGDIYSSQHKGIDRLFCRMPEPQTEDAIPNIFDTY